MIKRSLFFLMIFVLCINHTWSDDQKKHSRVRRYLAFPEGSIFTAVFCLTNLMGITPGSDIFSMNINWGLAYELPNDTKPLLDVYKPAMKRRNRRDLYGRIEKILTSMGYNGRTCMLRSICEAEQRFLKDEENLIYKILSIIFSFPQEPILDHEPDIHHIYHYASQMGRSNGEVDQPNDIKDKCSEAFKCPFSLIDFSLGYYSFTGT
ncbi:uncharacterized protein LOC126734277 [Anthonomus grandis grandis]|uniref:uncharacterized protein LOC126734277 n=1 Tax=Anthonomus grandis grandis TaxID=2921223 RepID=UPI00216601DA|nr:uncharacterized protein LOC126734277 [Anthonomus grandis grandis]